ncbi:Outer membrane protein beta-barrel domain-containing protein [Mariniphaga anaerophila]|uniref:Outer membrane protein beta-barrel domain-containing protein n=1 Tax=Mariniphaga anaerophila TaxID=1484053 RepID=A0A1M5AN77_9BACT|nr:porin family protein [Mariniphaga anaerophila]SHF31574.1 Outer membrane protein beta-barrel domain-containing protein [Mariniphaga anaerophila]
MKYPYLMFCILFFPILSYGQKEYILFDSTATVGIKLIDNGEQKNSMFCQVKKRDSIITYSPYDLQEYGFNKGPVYVSRDIQKAGSSKKVFLECLQRGKTTLYYYKGDNIQTFFIENDNAQLVELPKRNSQNVDYSKQLLNITKDCSNVADACELSRYSKKSLSKLIERYNNCELKPFPHFRYGVIAGYEFSRVIFSNDENLIEFFSYLDYFDNTRDGSFSSGIFIDNPILASDFSLHVELLFAKHRYSYSHSSENNNFNLVSNNTKINVPVLVRYSYPSNTIRPFINTGLSGSYLIKRETSLYEPAIESNISANKTSLNSLIDQYMLGYVFGAGLEYKLNFRNSLFFELRYVHQYGLSNPGSAQLVGLNLLTGISF